MYEVGAPYLLVLIGLITAGWGHLLLAQRRLAELAWRWLDELFPSAWRTPTPVAGAVLLATGAACVLAAVAG